MRFDAAMDTLETASMGEHPHDLVMRATWPDGKWAHLLGNTVYIRETSGRSAPMAPWMTDFRAEDWETMPMRVIRQSIQGPGAA